MMKYIPRKYEVKAPFWQPHIISCRQYKDDIVQSCLFSPLPYEIQILRIIINGVYPACVPYYSGKFRNCLPIFRKMR